MKVISILTLLSSSNRRSLASEDVEQKHILLPGRGHEDTSEDFLDTGGVSTRTKALSSSAMQWLAKCIIIMFAVYGLFNISIQIHGLTQSTDPASCDCGNSVEEAVGRGCKYDSLAAAWLPEHCRDDQLTAEFETQGPGPNGSWTYWRDSKHTIEISIPEIAAMAGDRDHLFRMSWDWHRGKC